MKNKKGFVFIETIIMIVVLAVSLLAIYGAYSAAINDEKTRLTYDDASHLYRNYYILNYLYSNNLKSFITSNLTGDNYVVRVGSGTSGLFADANQDASVFQSIVDSYNVSDMYIVSSKLITDCAGTCDLSNYGNNNTKMLLKNNVLLRRYIERMDIYGATNSEIKYFFVVEYREKYNEQKKRMDSCMQGTAFCKRYYASLEIPME